MFSNWHRIVALVAVVVLGWLLVSRSGGQESDPFREVAPPNVDLFGEAQHKTPVAIPNAVAAPRVQWEYDFIAGNVFDARPANKLGADGWELVTIYQQDNGDVRAVFKRPKM